jgi:hypothetical protein
MLTEDVHMLIRKNSDRLIDLNSFFKELWSTHSSERDGKIQEVFRNIYPDFNDFYNPSLDIRHLESPREFFLDFKARKLACSDEDQIAGGSVKKVYSAMLYCFAIPGEVQIHPFVLYRYISQRGVKKMPNYLEAEFSIAQRLEKHPHCMGIPWGVAGPTSCFRSRAIGDAKVENLISWKIDIESRIEMIVQLASALKHCKRKKVFHGDIRPENLFLYADPAGRILSQSHGPLSLKIGDYSSAKQVDQVAFKWGDASIITMTPEHFHELELDEQSPYRADMWAFAITAIELLLLHLPFRVKDLRPAYDIYSCEIWDAQIETLATKEDEIALYDACRKAELSISQAKNFSRFLVLASSKNPAARPNIEDFSFSFKQESCFQQLLACLLSRYSL